MFAQAGVPLVISAIFEMNPLVMSIMGASAIAHELTAIADVHLALQSDRQVSQGEQHIHSFLEVMPFWVAPLMVLLYEPSTSEWKLVRRRSALSIRDLIAVATAITVIGIVPYAEELLRCWRNRNPRQPTLSSVRTSTQAA